MQRRNHVSVSKSPERGKAPYGFTRLAPARTTAVFDTYWAFAAERQATMLRRARGLPPPWTVDPILRQHRFTNVYRAVDRVSQYLIRSVIYTGNASEEEVVFRILLFKIFNKIETWQLFTNELGTPTWKAFNLERYRAILSRSRQRGRSIYSGAYIMPSGQSSFGYQEKHSNHLALLEHMMRDGFARCVARAPSLSFIYESLRDYPTLGPFLAFQYTIDLNYAPFLGFSEMSFVVPGPGAKDGISKCFESTGGLSETEVIRFVADVQHEEFEARGLRFESLGGRSLQLVDCQNLFCEVDKYSRVAHPEVTGRSARTRIKQSFSPSPDPLELWFPPAWGINELVQKQLSGSPQDESVLWS